jgi:hypothetical protein
LVVLALQMPLAAAEWDGTSRAEVRVLFERLRELESQSHLERIRILERAEVCIRQAGDFHAYRLCEDAEGDARDALRDRLRPQFHVLRADWRVMRDRIEPATGD